jgi:hypothetical protein
MPVTRPPSAVPGPGTPEWVKKRIKTWHGVDGPLYETNDYGVFRRTYLATLLSVDDAVGEVYETLESMGELDNTVFVYAGDNGFLLGEHASIDKRTAREESCIRFSCAIRDDPPGTRGQRHGPEYDLAPSLVRWWRLRLPGRARTTFVRFRGSRPANRRNVSLRIQLRERVPTRQRPRRSHRRLKASTIRTERADTSWLSLQPRGGSVEMNNLISAEVQPKLAELKAELYVAEGAARHRPDAGEPQLGLSCPKLDRKTCPTRHAPF